MCVTLPHGYHKSYGNVATMGKADRPLVEAQGRGSGRRVTTQMGDVIVSVYAGRETPLVIGVTSCSVSW